jgi:hypothetical protein
MVTIALIDFITLAVQTCKKFNALLAKLKALVPAPVTGDAEKTPITQQAKLQLEEQLKQAEAQIKNSNQKISELEKINQKLTTLQSQEPGIEKSELVGSKVKLETNDSKSNCPCISDGKLYVSTIQAGQMKTDPYFQKFFSERLDMTIGNGELFLNNLSIFLNPTIQLLCQQANSLGIFQLQNEIAANTKEFSDLFVHLGLSKDKAFIYHNGDLIGTGLQTVLTNLKNADMMENQVLILFWAQALKQFVPFDECIDLFPTILETPLAHPEYLHEILFECLVKNFKTTETQHFLNNYKGKLKIKSLNLGTLLGVAEGLTYNQNPNKYDQNKDKLDKLLNILDLQYVEILNRGSIDGVSAELKYVLTRCPQIICLRNDGTTTGRTIESLAEVEKAIPIIDLTAYIWRVDSCYFNNTDDRIFVKKRINNDKHMQFIYLTKDRELVDKYLKIYHGVTLDQTV